MEQGYHHRAAASAYRQTLQQALGTREAMARIIARQIHRLQEGREAYIAKRFDVMSGHHTKLLQAIILLNSVMTMDAGAPDAAEARASLRFHRDAFEQTLEDVANILRAPEPLLVFDKVDARLRTLYKAWAS